MVKKVIGFVIAILSIVIALGFVLPDKVNMERSVVVSAPQEEVFALVADLNQADRWSPWVDHDPDMKAVVTGDGVGQKQSWTSKKLGNGSQEIVALDPIGRVNYALDFGDRGVATAAMTLEPVAGGTKVVWSFETNMREGVPLWMRPISTYMGFFMDGMLGKDYENGLAKLKTVAEAG